MPSQAPASRPHATLTVAERIDPDVDAVLASLTDRFPFRCRIGAPLLFGRSKVVLARLVVPATELLEVHAEVHRLCLPHLGAGADAQRPARPVDRARHDWPAASPRRSWVGRCGSRGGRARSPGSVVGLRRWDGNTKLEYPIS